MTARRNMELMQALAPFCFIRNDVKPETGDERRSLSQVTVTTAV